jgi:hypothetical protein
MGESGAEQRRTSGTSPLEEFAVRSRHVARQQGVDAEALRVLAALRQAGVTALLLKGAVLARVLYGRDEARGYYDVDLLVASEALRTAGRALADLGFTNVSALRGVDDVAGILHAEEWSASVGGIGNLMVDLHWRLPGSQAPPEVVWNRLSARRIFVEVQGHHVPALDQPALALHLALHAAQHGAGDLKAIGDLERGLQRWPRPTWRRAAELADDLRATEAFAAGLRLVPSGASLADELRMPAAGALLWAIAHRDTRPRGTFHLDAFAHAGSTRERIDVLRRSLLPSRAWIVWEYHWASRGLARTAAAYLIHIGRAPLWTIRAWRFSRRNGPGATQLRATRRRGG